MWGTGAITIVSVFLWHEPGRAQPLRQVLRPIVPVQFPLEAPAALGECVHLARDQRIEVGTFEPAEVAVDDEATARPTEEAKERPVPLDPDSPWQRVGNAVANLRVVGGEQLGDVRHELTLAPRPRL